MNLKSQTRDPQLKIPPGGLGLMSFYVLKIVHGPQLDLNPRTLDLEASTLPRDHRGRQVTILILYIIVQDQDGQNVNRQVQVCLQVLLVQTEKLDCQNTMRILDSVKAHNRFINVHIYVDVNVKMCFIMQTTIHYIKTSALPRADVGAQTLVFST